MRLPENLSSYLFYFNFLVNVRYIVLHAVRECLSPMISICFIVHLYTNCMTSRILWGQNCVKLPSHLPRLTRTIDYSHTCPLRNVKVGTIHMHVATNRLQWNRNHLRSLWGVGRWTVFLLDFDNFSTTKLNESWKFDWSSLETMLIFKLFTVIVGCVHCPMSPHTRHNGFVLSYTSKSTEISPSQQ